MMPRLYAVTVEFVIDAGDDEGARAKIEKILADNKIDRLLVDKSVFYKIRATIPYP